MAKLVTFDSGLRLFYKKHPSSQAFALGVFVGAGCVCETPQNSGIAHFIEHMVFKGTETRSAYDIADETDKNGVMINAYTSRQFTAYYTIGMAEYADICADVLSDIYFNATFTPENIEKEKSVVMEEINMYEDDSEDVCVENLIRAHFGRNMLAAPILGTKTTVKNMSRDSIGAFMDKYYRPENTCIAVVGNLPYEDAEKLVNKYFASKMQKRGFTPDPTRKIAPKRGYRAKIKPIEQSAIGIAFPSYSEKNKLRLAPSILAGILGGGMSSRLFQEVREKEGLVYEVYATNNQFASNGYFVIYLATAPEQAVRAVKKVREVLQSALDSGVTQEEFDKAVAQFKTGLVLGGESAADVMRMGGRYGLKGVTVTHKSTLKELEKITLADVNVALKSVIDFSLSSMSYVGQDCGVNLRDLFVGDEGGGV